MFLEILTTVQFSGQADIMHYSRWDEGTRSAGVTFCYAAMSNQRTDVLDYSYLPKDFSLKEFFVNDGEYFILKDNTKELSTIPIMINTKDVIGKFH